MKTETQNNVISESARIGNNLKIGYFNIIEDGVVIGDNVEIGNYCHLKSGVVIGDNTVIMNNVELRKDTVLGKECYVDSGVKSSGNVKVGNKVVLRYDTILARGCDIGDNTYICPRVMTNNLSADKSPIGGAKVGANCFIGTNAVLHYGIVIEDEVVVGAMSFVNKDVEARQVVMGVPAKVMKK